MQSKTTEVITIRTTVTTTVKIERTTQEKEGSIIKVGVITKRKTNDSQTDKVSLTRKHTGGESLVRERVYNRTAEIGRRPD